MRNRRTIAIIGAVVLILLLLVGGAFIALTTGIIGGPPADVNGPPDVAEEATETPTPTQTPQVAQVIVASRNIPRGARLTVQDVRVVTYPNPDANPLPSSFITVSETQGLEQVEGRVARTDILQNEPINDFQLTEVDDPTGFVDTGSDDALQIPSGFVAVAVPVTRFSGVGFVMREGDHLDIAASYRFVNVDRVFQAAPPHNAALIGPTAVDDFGNITFGVIYEYGYFYEGDDDFSSPNPPLFLDDINSGIAISPNETQRPRQVTQMIIDNVVVLRVGVGEFQTFFDPIIIPAEAPGVPSRTDPADVATEGETGTEGGETGTEGGEEQAPTPTPEPAAQPTAPPSGTATPIPPPDMMVLIMRRQDYLVLKYSYEVGADIDFMLRSAQDNDVTDIATDSVTLWYLLERYNVEVPPREHIAHDPRIDTLPFAEEWFEFRENEIDELIAQLESTLEEDVPGGAGAEDQ